jgi:hypothetical protein
MSNMDDFNEATAKILAKLYEAFPQRQSFKVADLVESTDENKIRTYSDTIIFLEREGFIRYESYVTNDHFNNVSLTSKGLAILNSTPDALQERVPLGTKLINAARDGSQAVIKMVVEQLINNALGRQ